MPIDAKPLRDLFDLGTMLRRRDAIVRAAQRAGVSKIEIASISGLSRNTVDRILARDAREGQDRDVDDGPAQ